MEITRERLPLFLKRPSFFPIYCVSGNEIVLVQEALECIQVALKTQGFLEREVVIVDREFDWSALIRMSFQRSLFSKNGFKIIDCRVQEGGINASGKKVLAQYGEAPAKTCVWIVSCPQIPKFEHEKSWMKSIKEKGVFVPIWHLEGTHHKRFIQQKLRTANLPITPSALDVLAEYTERNLLAAKQTIEHFSSIRVKEPITEEDIQSALSNVSAPEVFDIIESWLKEDIPKLFSSLSQLKIIDSMANLRLVGAFIAEVRQLARMAEEVAKGTPIPNVLQTFKVWPRRKKWVLQKLQKTPLHAWYALWNALLEIECIQKGVQTGDIWNALTAFLVNTLPTAQRACASSQNKDQVPTAKSSPMDPVRHREPSVGQIDH
ncbi:MAG: DNA polymerase III subunit delta [Gammaproteobacteria bacterium]|nr:DNA polymerase III subunit delta [Gammaproteobacteria bacterium]